MNKRLSDAELNRLLSVAVDEYVEARESGARHWQMTAGQIVETVSRFLLRPHIESESPC